MDIRSFKNADIDRKNAEKKCARCGWRFEDEEQIYYRDNSTLPLCPACYDEMTEEEGAFAEGGEELLEKVRQTRLELFGRADGTGQNEEDYADEEGGAEELEMLLEKMRGTELVVPTADNLDEFYNDEEQREIYQALKKKFDPDMVSAEIVEEGHPYDGTPHHYCVECDCCVGCDCCECRRLLVCLYCGRDENECEEQTEEEQNPITDWFGGWGMSCDDCYYKHHPEDEEKDELNSAIDASGNALY